MSATHEALVSRAAEQPRNGLRRRGERILQRGLFDFDVFESRYEDLRAEPLAVRVQTDAGNATDPNHGTHQTPRRRAIVMGYDYHRPSFPVEDPEMDTIPVLIPGSQNSPRRHPPAVGYSGVEFGHSPHLGTW